MSLPVYNAISFQQILDKGGHSKPWVVLVDVDGIPSPYVVKLYRTIDIEARNKMTAEVLGNILANSFGLKAPSAAIIEFSPDFCMQLNSECDTILANMDDRHKFGSEYIDGSYLFQPTDDKKIIEKYTEPALLYAFDYFICNRDRGSHKPNLLIKGSDSIVIDHEMALEITSEQRKLFLNRSWDSRYQHHLFHQYLRSLKDKHGVFDEFMEYLHNLNLGYLSSYFNQLEQFGFTTQKELIIDYWMEIKRNPCIFANILKSSIQ